MTAAAYRAIRQRLELTQADLAKKLELTFNTISRRELGQLPITKEADLALRWIEAELVFGWSKKGNAKRSRG
jgi:transcriptional regulator with XRE-family HTH domain